MIRPFLHPNFKRYYSPLSTLELVRDEFRSANLEPLTKTNVDRFFALKYDLPTYLLNFLADRVEMAHSIEGRLPFLDDDVVAFAAKLSDEALIGKSAGKKLIRTAFTQRLPQEAIASGKRIFLAPPSAVNAILQSDWAHHLLSESVTNEVGVFDWSKLKLLGIGLKVTPACSGLGSALRSLLIMIISIHALHELFVVNGVRRRPG